MGFGLWIDYLGRPGRVAVYKSQVSGFVYRNCSILCMGYIVVCDG